MDSEIFLYHIFQPNKRTLLFPYPAVIAFQPLSITIKSFSFLIVSLRDGSEALKIIEAGKDRIDIIITDLVLPNISGIAVISMVKKKYPMLPVIGITGWGEYPEALAKEAKADLVMEKPVRLSKLEKAVRDLLNQ